MCHCAAAGWWSGSPGCPDCLAVVTFSFPARMSGRRTLFIDQRCTSVVYCSTCLYRPRANIMRLHSFVLGLVVVSVSEAFLWVISTYAVDVSWRAIFVNILLGVEDHLQEQLGQAALR